MRWQGFLFLFYHIPFPLVDGLKGFSSINAIIRMVG